MDSSLNNSNKKELSFVEKIKNSNSVYRFVIGHSHKSFDPPKFY